MYKYLILAITLISLQSCGQNKENMDVKSTEILGNLYKDVKHQDQRINYQAMIFIGGCNYEVLINDYPVDRYFGPGNGSASGDSPINIAILKPGTQTWKIRVYPARDRKDVNGETTLIPQDAIQPGARVEMNIEGVRFAANGDIEKRFGKVVEFTAPVKLDNTTGKNMLSDAGKPYTEYSGTFQADVPYTLVGWENSTDLRSVDSTVLQQQLVKEYKKFHGWLQDNDVDQIAARKLVSEKEIAQAYFYDKATNDRFLAEFMQRWGQKNLKMQPLENYKVAIYGDGKIATLIDVIDNGSPLWGNYEVGEDQFKHNTYLLYFHIPKGKKELELIR